MGFQHDFQIKQRTIGQRILLGQALIEFALILPIMLLLIYGVIEFSRVSLAYISAVSSVESASRYASGIGVNNDGVVHYRDCEGIRDIIRTQVFFSEMDGIEIKYDRGSVDTTFAECGDNVTLSTGDRVRVTGHFIYRFFVLYNNVEINWTFTSAHSIVSHVPITHIGGGNGSGNNETPTPTLTPVPTYTLTPTPTATPTATPCWFWCP